MYKKYFLLLMTLLVVNAAEAQTAVGKGVVKAAAKQGACWAPRRAVRVVAARSSQAALRQGGLSYIERNAQVGQEITAGNSMVGTLPYQTYHKIKDNTHFLGDKISSAVARALAGTSKDFFVFPAYYKSFPQERIDYQKPLGIYECILEAAYGENATFDGMFVRSFDEAIALTQQPVKEPLSAAQAMDKALQQADKVKSGFFVITVTGNEHRAKDVLLLDLSKNRFISLNKSKALVWAQIAQRQGKAEPFLGRRAYLTRYDMAQVPMKDVVYLPLARGEQDQPIADALFAVMLDKGNEVWINMHDGLNGTVWHGFSILEEEELAAMQVKANILEAMEKGYYIFQQNQTSPVLFSAQLGKPLFKTVGEVDAYLAAQKNN